MKPEGIRNLSEAVLRCFAYDLLRCRDDFTLEVLSFWEQLWCAGEVEAPVRRGPEEDGPHCPSCGAWLSQEDRRRQKRLIRRIDRGYRLDDLKRARYPYDFFRQCEALRRTHLTQGDICRFIDSEGANNGEGPEIRFNDQERAIRKLCDNPGSVAHYMMAAAARKRQLREHSRGRPENVLAVLIYRITHAM